MMAFELLNCEQRSDAWRLARAGRMTGSRAAAATALPLKSGESAARRDYRMQLIAERLTGRPQEDAYVTATMQHGIDTEPLALAAYEAASGHVAMPVGFVALTAHAAGCSPDGVIGDFAGLVSVKCPKTATHLSYLRAGKVPTEYLPQIVCELWVTGAEWCDFVSFDPRLPDALQLFVIRYNRDEPAIVEFERRALAFLAEVQNELECVRTLGDLRGQLTRSVA